MGKLASYTKQTVNATDYDDQTVNATDYTGQSVSATNYSLDGLTQGILLQQNGDYLLLQDGNPIYY